MGGRGAKLGKYYNHKTHEWANYGDEFTTLLEVDNIKFVFANSDENYTPMETMTSGRIYVIVKKDKQGRITDNLGSVVFFDKNNNRFKQIDLDHEHKKMKEHTHHGYFHNENDGPNGGTLLDKSERKIVDNIKDIWKNYLEEIR